MWHFLVDQKDVRVTFPKTDTSCTIEGADHLQWLFSSVFVAFHRLVQVLVSMIIHGFPHWSFDSLTIGLASGVGEGAQNTFFMCSQGELIRAFPNNSSWEICRGPWLCLFLGPRFFLQIPDFYCRTIVRCTELPEPIHYSEATFLQQAYDHPDWAVAIFLLVCQEF